MICIGENLEKERNLAGADMSGLYLSGIKLMGLNMKGADFHDSNLANAILAMADMPNYYVSDSLSTIFHLGRINDPTVWQNLLILAVISVVIGFAGIQLFKRVVYR